MSTQDKLADVLHAAFGQYFDVNGLVSLDIQDDAQVDPLINYLALAAHDSDAAGGQGVPDGMLHIGDVRDCGYMRRHVEWTEAAADLPDGVHKIFIAAAPSPQEPTK